MRRPKTTHGANVTLPDLPPADPGRLDDCFLPIWVAAERLARGETTAHALVDACHAAWVVHHATINALVLPDFEAARTAARESDRRRQAGAALGPRDGLPCGVQIVARRWGDLTSLRFAQLLEAAGYAYQPPRGLASAGIDR